MKRQNSNSYQKGQSRSYTEKHLRLLLDYGKRPLMR